MWYITINFTLMITLEVKKLTNLKLTRHAYEDV